MKTKNDIGFNIIFKTTKLTLSFKNKNYLLNFILFFIE
jgi:hypothetical protein